MARQTTSSTVCQRSLSDLLGTHRVLGIRVSKLLTAIREKIFARRTVRRFLRAHAEVSAARPDLSGRELYREILLHTPQVEKSSVNGILLHAENSVDEWTAPGREGLRFRELVHYFVVSQYIAAGHRGTLISFRKIVDALVPEDI